MTCVQNGEVYLIDHSYFSRPGPRTIEGLEILAQLTHPDLFNGLVPRNAVVKLDVQRYEGRPDGEISDAFSPYY